MRYPQLRIASKPSMSLSKVAEQHGCVATRVSWTDLQRNVSSKGVVSCWGSRICDSYLAQVKPNGMVENTFFVRRQNLDEQVCFTTAGEVRVAVNDHGNVSIITLAEYLTGDYAEAAGHKGPYSDLPLKEMNEWPVKVGVQVTILEADEGAGTAGAMAANYQPTYYTYGIPAGKGDLKLYSTSTTTTPSYTTQGNGKLHTAVGDAREGTGFSLYTSQAVESRFKVGENQNSETDAERKAAAAKGHGVSTNVGVLGDEKRFNAEMVITVPMVHPVPEPKRGEPPRRSFGAGWEPETLCLDTVDIQCDGLDDDVPYLSTGTLSSVDTQHTPISLNAMTARSASASANTRSQPPQKVKISIEISTTTPEKEVPPSVDPVTGKQRAWPARVGPGQHVKTVEELLTEEGRNAKFDVKSGLPIDLRLMLVTGKMSGHDPTPEEVEAAIAEIEIIEGKLGGSFKLSEIAKAKTMAGAVSVPATTPAAAAAAAPPAAAAPKKVPPQLYKVVSIGGTNLT